MAACHRRRVPNALVAHECGRLPLLDHLKPRRLAPGLLRRNVEARLQRAGLARMPGLQLGALLAVDLQPLAALIAVQRLTYQFNTVDPPEKRGEPCRAVAIPGRMTFAHRVHVAASQVLTLGPVRPLLTLRQLLPSRSPDVRRFC